MRSIIRYLLLFLAIAALVSPAGCRKPRKQVLTKKQIREIQRSILEEAPTPTHKTGAMFEGNIELVGVDLPSDPVKQGESTEVTWYWRSVQAVEGEWKIFVHLEGSGRRSGYDHHAVGELYPIHRWEAGQLIRDRQKITIPKDFPEGTATFKVGIYDVAAWRNSQQNRRMQIANAGQGGLKTDAEARVAVGTIQIQVGEDGGDKAGKGSKGASSERKYTAFSVESPLTVDGALTESPWKRARATRAFVSPRGKGLTASWNTSAKMLWDTQNLYVGITCRDDDIWNDLKGRDATLWEQDVVEIYLDPGSDGQNYVELQVAPTGEIFDAVFTSRRKPQWPEAAKALHMSGLNARIGAAGSVNARDDEVVDRSWVAEIAIPWTDIPGVSGPPADGTIWSVNLYRIDGKSPKRGPFMAAWSPAGGDFHNTSGFGSVTFKKKRSVKPAAAAPKAAAPKAPAEPTQPPPAATGSTPPKVP